MNYPKDLCRLVIKNMDIIEAASSIVESVTYELFAAINARIEERVKIQQNWKGRYDLVTDQDGKDTAFIPNNWPTDEKGKYLIYYRLTHAHGNIEYLSHATGGQGATLVLSFTILSTKVYNMLLGVYKTKLADFYTRSVTIQAAGFVLSEAEDEILRPFTFDPEMLAAEYSDSDSDFDEALAPLDAALDDLFKVHKEFDTFVKNLGKPV